jgi:hypothetical protein
MSSVSQIFLCIKTVKYRNFPTNFLFSSSRETSFLVFRGSDYRLFLSSIQDIFVSLQGNPPKTVLLLLCTRSAFRFFVF